MGASLQTLKGHVGGVNSVDSVAFSPDGWLLASGGRVKYGGLASDGVVRLWDLKTGASLQTLKGHPGGANLVVFSPDGRLLAFGSGHGHDGTVLSSHPHPPPYIIIQKLTDLLSLRVT